jgi:hypothetical protein
MMPLQAQVKTPNELMGHRFLTLNTVIRVNQKQTRPQDKPVPFKALPEEYRQIIRQVYPYLFPEIK